MVGDHSPTPRRLSATGSASPTWWLPIGVGHGLLLTASLTGLLSLAAPPIASYAVGPQIVLTPYVHINQAIVMATRRPATGVSYIGTQNG